MMLKQIKQQRRRCRSVEQFESATEPAKLAFLVRHQKPLKMLGHDRQTRQFRASVTRCFIPTVFELFKNMRDLQCLHAAEGGVVIHQEIKEIGRAWGRENVCMAVYIWVVAVSLKKKK